MIRGQTDFETRQLPSVGFEEPTFVVMQMSLAFASLC